MKKARKQILKFLLPVAAIMFVTGSASAGSYWLVNGGSNGTGKESSIGFEVGDTTLIQGKIPLAAEISMNFSFDDVPSDTHFNTNPGNEPYSTKTVDDGPEIGFVFKSGVNLDDLVKNLTLQVGAGYALQAQETVATGAVSGKHWQQGGRDVEVFAVGYGGLLYRLGNMSLSAGYNNRRGVVAGGGRCW